MDSLVHHPFNLMWAQQLSIFIIYLESHLDFQFKVKTSYNFIAIMDMGNASSEDYAERLSYYAPSN